MSIDRVANRYAKAFFEVVIEQNKLDDVAKDIAGIAKACDSADLVSVLRNPVVEGSKKEAIVNDLFGSKVSDSTQSLFKLLASRDRLTVLKEVCEAWLALEKDHRGIVDATLTSARELDSATVDKLAQGLGQKIGKTINVNTAIDADLMGGFRLQLADRVYDCSIKHQLDRLRTALSAGV